VNEEVLLCAVHITLYINRCTTERYINKLIVTRKFFLLIDELEERASLPEMLLEERFHLDRTPGWRMHGERNVPVCGSRRASRFVAISPNHPLPC
jgi:hypothetical protein